jgi:bisphosphoglycerate-independent phosphoglycerate mutase (AlkP superfamily)
MLGVYPTDLFMVEYITSGRSVTEQVLNFTLEEKNRLYNALVENYKPENRYYAYDFFRDNCATRVRDMLELAAGRPVFSTQYAAGNPTYRKLYYHCTDNMLWWR